IQTQGRKAFNVERLEDRRMLCGNTMTISEYEALVSNIISYTVEECQNDKPCIDAVDGIGASENAGATAWKTTVEAGHDPADGKKGSSLFIDLADELGAAESAGENAVESAEDTALAIGNYIADPNSPGWLTGFLGIPYKNLEDTTPGGEDDDEQEDGGVGDEDDKLTWASWLGGASDGQEESSDGDGQEEGSSGDDEGSEEEDSSGDEDDDDGITWFWEDDDDDDDDEEGDGQSRPTENSRDSDPRRSGSGPDPRQGGDGRPGGGSKTDPTPYRGAIVQGGNSDPSDPDSGRSGPGVGPEHPSYGAIDYGPDGKPVDYQGYLPPKDLLVQGGDSDPPKNSEHLAVDALFSDLGAEHASTVVEATARKVTGQKSVDLGGNLPTF
ncbi:MAG: hypothetical protein OSA43_05680, partial [Pirellulales bacterium]|nr:hypothetical protein [Pirellulales bacterium]